MFDKLKGILKNDTGFFSTKEKGATDPPPGTYEDFVEEIKQLAPKMWDEEVSPDDRITARRRFEEIKSALNKNDATSAEDLVSEIIVDQVSTAGNVNTEQKDIMKKAVIANLGLAAVKTGTGLAQIIDGAFKKKNLTPPKLPQRYTKNALLSNEIAKSQVRSENGDAATRAKFEKDLANKNVRDEGRARARGNIGEFSALLQSSNRSTNDALIDYAKHEDGQKRTERANLNNLIGKSMGEDQFMQSELWKEFNVENRAYQSSMQGAQSQMNSGYSNIFQGLNEGAATAPFASIIKKNDSSSSGNGFPEEDSYGDIIKKEVSDNSIPPINNATMAMLGNAANRTPSAIERFQVNAQKYGKLKDFEPGIWDPNTEEAYNSSMNLDALETTLNADNSNAGGFKSLIKKF